FDFDGLLVDTEAEWIRVQDAYLAMHDVRMDAATRREITGRAAEVVVTAIGALVGKDPQLVGDELLAAHRERLRDRDGLRAPTPACSLWSSRLALSWTPAPHSPPPPSTCSPPGCSAPAPRRAWAPRAPRPGRARPSRRACS